MKENKRAGRADIDIDTVAGVGSKTFTEGGFTLVEVLVGMFILGATMIPTSRVFTGGVGASAFAARQSEAVALASGELSKVQSSTYSAVGFYGSQVSKAEVSYPWYTPGQGGSSYVYLGSNPPSGYDPLLVPVYPTQVGNASFTVATYIDWANAEVPGGTGGITTDYQAYKEASVSVRWYQAGTQSGIVSQSTIIYSGAQGVYNGPGGASGSSPSPSSSGSGGSQSGSPSAPATLSAAKATGPSGSSTIDVTWSGGSVPASSTSSTSNQSGYYVVEYSANINDLPSAYTSGTGAMPSVSGVAASPHQLATATNYQIGGLAPGVTYYIEVIAFGAGGQSWATSGIIAQATTSASASSPSSSGPSSYTSNGCGQTQESLLASPTPEITAGSTANIYYLDDTAFSGGEVLVNGSVDSNVTIQTVTTSTNRQSLVAVDNCGGSPPNPDNPTATGPGSSGGYESILSFQVPSNVVNGDTVTIRANDGDGNYDTYTWQVGQNEQTDGNCNQSSTTSCNDNGNENENDGCSIISLTVTGASSANTGKTYLTSNGLMSENLDLATGLIGCQNGTVQVSASPVGSSLSDPGSPYTLTLQSSANAQAGSSASSSQGAQFVGTVYSAGQSGWVTGQHLFNVVYDGSDVGVSASILVCAWMPPSERSSSQNEC